MSERVRGGRFPLLAPGDLTEDQRALHDAVAGPPRGTGPFLVVDDDGLLAGPFNALLHIPGIGQAVQALGSAVRFGGTLDDRTRELVVCAVAAELGSDYEWYAHSRVARFAGITETQLEDLRAGRTPSNLAPGEQAALALTAQLLRGRGVDAGTHGEVLAHHGHSGVAELAVVVGYYQMLAGILAAGDVPAPTDPPESTTTTQGREPS